MGPRARRPRRAATGCARGRLPVGGSLSRASRWDSPRSPCSLSSCPSPRAPSAATAGALAPRRRGPRVRPRLRRHPSLDAGGGRLAAAARSAGGLSQRLPGLRRAGPSRPAPDRARSRGGRAAGRRRPPRGRGGRVLEGFVASARRVGPRARGGGHRRARGRRLPPPSSARGSLREPRALSAARTSRSADRRRRGGLATRSPAADGAIRRARWPESPTPSSGSRPSSPRASCSPPATSAPTTPSFCRCL